jgi:hypothetical protein
MIDGRANGTRSPPGASASAASAKKTKLPGCAGLPARFPRHATVRTLPACTDSSGASWCRAVSTQIPDMTHLGCICASKRTWK